MTLGDKDAQRARRPSKASTVSVLLRLPDDFVTKIDTCLQSRPIHTPLHTWILEAILDKLSKDYNHLLALEGVVPELC